MLQDHVHRARGAPRYIVKRPGETTYLDEVRRAALNNLLSEHYELWKSARDIEVYRLR